MKIRQAAQFIADSLLFTIAALWYAIGFVLGRCVMLVLWCWAALVQGYRAGL